MAKSNKSTTTPPPALHHPSLDTTNRFALDQLIRKEGFKIITRASGLTVWERNGQEYTQSEVIELLNWHEVQDAEYQQNLYYDGYRR